MRIIKTTLTGLVIFLLLALTYHFTPKPVRYAISDWFERLSAPRFDAAPDAFTAKDQERLIADYRSRDYKLQCYGTVLKQEKIANADFLCTALIKSAYNDIPAGRVTFYFTQQQLSSVGIQFPESSYAKVRAYLDRQLADVPRLDTVRGSRFGSDTDGSPLMVWGVGEGIVITNSAATKGDNVLILWMANDWRMNPLYRDL